jgi:predicted phosphodiesterase
MKAKWRQLAPVLALALIVAILYVVLSGFGKGSPLTFAVMGDSQGNSKMLMAIVEEINSMNPDLVIHLGDCVAIARTSLYDSLAEEVARLDAPLRITPGNHDIKGDSTLFASYFGEGDYSFDLKGYRFISLDTSRQLIADEQLEWLRGILEGSGGMKTIIFTHVPPFDPLPGSDHGLLDGRGDALMALAEEFQVEAVLAGHIHVFNHTQRNGVDYFISGGAGAGLYASPDQGGFHHFMIFTESKGDLEFRVVKVEAELDEETIHIASPWGNSTLDISSLRAMETVEGDASYQNQLGNWRGNGTYSGVRVADLLEMVGGISPGDTLRAVASDDYYQEYCYWNVYPNATWRDLQGEMILAWAFDGSEVPKWDKGPTVAFLPPDGAYSNQDCLLTSCPGQGCHEYLSGGSRWVKDVTRLLIIRNE